LTRSYARQTIPIIKVVSPRLKVLQRSWYEVYTEAEFHGPLAVVAYSSSLEMFASIRSHRGKSIYESLVSTLLNDVKRFSRS
jgi:hypothetical protein